jgi:hypothetical protein
MQNVYDSARNRATFLRLLNATCENEKQVAFHQMTSLIFIMIMRLFDRTDADKFAIIVRGRVQFHSTIRDLAEPAVGGPVSGTFAYASLGTSAYPGNVDLTKSILCGKWDNPAVNDILYVIASILTRPSATAATGFILDGPINR